MTDQPTPPVPALPDAELRASLTSAARQIDSPGFRRLVDDALTGKRTLRDVTRAPEFQRLAAPRIANLVAGIERLSDAERARVLDPNRTTPAPSAPPNPAPPPPPATPRAKRRPAVEDDEDYSQDSYLSDEGW